MKQIDDDWTGKSGKYFSEDVSSRELTATLI